MAVASYTRGAILFHWAIALLILLTTGLALFRETFSPFAVDMISVHKATGLMILLLSLGRLAWRLTHRPPPFPAGVGPVERVVANAVHWLLYGFMIAVPLAGWIFVSLAPDSRPPDFRGLESVPELPFAHDDGAALAWHEAHELMGFAMIGLFLLHIAGALRSQMRHGDFLDRMVTRSSPYGALRLLAALAASVWVLGLALDMLGVRFWAD